MKARSKLPLCVLGVKPPPPGRAGGCNLTPKTNRCHRVEKIIFNWLYIATLLSFLYHPLYPAALIVIVKFEDYLGKGRWEERRAC